MFACQYGHTGIVLMLLRHGATVDQRNEVMIMNIHSDHSILTLSKLFCDTELVWI